MSGASNPRWDATRTRASTTVPPHRSGRTRGAPGIEDASRTESGTLFLEGQGWGFGGSVDVAAIDAWNVPGRYGWIGGTGTAAHLTPSTGTVTILLSQVEMSGPTAPTLLRDFWRYAAGA